MTGPARALALMLGLAALVVIASIGVVAAREGAVLAGLLYLAVGLWLLTRLVRGMGRTDSTDIDSAPQSRTETDA